MEFEIAGGFLSSIASFIPAIISGGSSLLGGILGNDANEDANNANLYQQERFAKNAIQWKTADAKKAGLHPLAALGAQTSSFSPSFIGGGSQLSQGISNAGQDLGRAVAATQTKEQKLTGFTHAQQALTTENMALQNALLAAKIANYEQAGGLPHAPGTPGMMDGQSNNLVEDMPLQRTTPHPNNPSAIGAAVPDTGYIQTSDGGYQPIPPKGAKEGTEESWLRSLFWNVRNFGGPTVGEMNPPPWVKLRPNQEWIWNYAKLQYEIRTKRKYKNKRGQTVTTTHGGQKVRIPLN